MAELVVVWDWNGTLFDDRTLLLDVVGHTLRGAGYPSLTPEDLAERFDRPLRKFFERACGRRLDDPEWEQLEADFRTLYRARAAELALVAGAHDALAYGHRIAAQQYLLSLAPHDELLSLTRRYRISDYFTDVQGRTTPHDDKSTLLSGLIQRHGLDPSTLVHIGDALDDAAAARATGATPILVTGASLEIDEPARRARLSPLVASSLVHAIETAGGLW